MLELHWWSSRTCLFYRFLARPSLTAISSLLSQYFASVSVWAIVLSWPAAGHPAWPDYCYIPGWPPVDHHQCHVSSPAKMDYNNNLNSDNKTILWTTKSETISAFSLQPGTVIAVSYNFTEKLFEWKFISFLGNFRSLSEMIIIINGLLPHLTALFPCRKLELLKLFNSSSVSTSTDFPPNCTNY